MNQWQRGPRPFRRPGNDQYTGGPPPRQAGPGTGYKAGPGTGGFFQGPYGPPSPQQVRNPRYFQPSRSGPSGMADPYQYADMPPNNAPPPRSAGPPPYDGAPPEDESHLLMPGILSGPPSRHAPVSPQFSYPTLHTPPLEPGVAAALQRFITFPYYDPNQVVCDCGCGVHIEVNTIIGDLCAAMLAACEWDYARYKHLFDTIIQMVDQSGMVPFVPRNGFVTFARQTGVTHFAWAIMDDDAANQTLEIITNVVEQHELPAIRTIISIGAGNGYVEHVFLKQAQQLEHSIQQVVAYDTHPSGTPYVPIQVGTPMNILTDFSSTEDCALLLCWPPLGTSLADGSYNPNADPNKPTNTMASDSLRNFELKGGRFLIYIGERTMFACTGDPKFHELLAQGRWVLVNEDNRGHSTVQMQKWCPQAEAVPNDYAGLEHQIGGVSGNDNVWIYFLPPEHDGAPLYSRSSRLLWQQEHSSPGHSGPTP